MAYDLRLLYGEDGGWHGFSDPAATRKYDPTERLERLLDQTWRERRCETGLGRGAVKVQYGKGNTGKRVESYIYRGTVY